MYKLRTVVDEMPCHVKDLCLFTGSDASVSDTSTDSLESERLVEIRDVTDASTEASDPELPTPMGSNLSRVEMLVLPLRRSTQVTIPTPGCHLCEEGGGGV